MFQNKAIFPNPSNFRGKETAQESPDVQLIIFFQIKTLEILFKGILIEIQPLIVSNLIINKQITSIFFLSSLTVSFLQPHVGSKFEENWQKVFARGKNCCFATTLIQIAKAVLRAGGAKLAASRWLRNGPIGFSSFSPHMHSRLCITRFRRRIHYSS